MSQLAPSAARETGRVAPGHLWGRTRGGGPLRPARSSKSCDSGEWVTEPAGSTGAPPTGPARLTGESIEED